MGGSYRRRDGKTQQPASLPPARVTPLPRRAGRPSRSVAVTPHGLADRHRNQPARSPHSGMRQMRSTSGPGVVSSRRRGSDLIAFGPVVVTCSPVAFRKSPESGRLRSAGRDVPSSAPISSCDERQAERRSGGPRSAADGASPAGHGRHRHRDRNGDGAAEAKLTGSTRSRSAPPSARAVGIGGGRRRRPASRSGGLPADAGIGGGGTRPRALRGPALGGLRDGCPACFPPAAARPVEPVGPWAARRR